MEAVAVGYGSVAVASEKSPQVTAYGVTLTGPDGSTVEAHNGQFFINGDSLGKILLKTAPDVFKIDLNCIGFGGWGLVVSRTTEEIFITDGPDKKLLQDSNLYGPVLEQWPAVVEEAQKQQASA